MKNRLIPVVLATLLAGAGLTAQAAVSPTPSSAAVGASVDLAKRGADDGVGHQRRGRGQDDGPNHT